MNSKPAILEIEEKLYADARGSFLNESVASMETYAQWLELALNKGANPGDYAKLMQLKECSLLAVKIFQDTWAVMHRA
jgi:hypothetical protein